MAINKGGSSDNTQGPNQGPQAAPHQGPAPGASAADSGAHQQPGAGQRQQRRSVMDLNSMMRRPVSRRSTGEVVQRFRDSLEKSVEKNMDRNQSSAFRLEVLDNNTNNVPLSSILVCYHQRINGHDKVAVYTLLVEDSGPRLSPQTINLGGKNVEIDTVAGDVFNGYLWGIIVDHINGVFGKDMEVMDGGAMVLPSELDPEDDEHIRRVLFNATSAVVTVMESELNVDPQGIFSVSWINNPGDSLVARLDYNPSQPESATGEPIRSDLRVTLQGSVSSAQPVTGFEQVRDISTVDGFVDLVYTPPQSRQQPGQPAPTQHYHPRFVITRADSQVDAVTMELQLLALSTTTLLSRNLAWAGVFRPRHGVKGVDTRDIGAIGFEVPFAGDKPKRIDTKANDFDINKLYQLVSMAVNDSLMYSMDVEEVGELSWIHQAFIAAANGNQDANQLILDSANNLTEGWFAQIFQGGGVAVDDQVRVHTGYYIDEDGRQRDLREIDYLAMLNMVGESSPELVAKWGETFDNVNIPLEVRLEERANILKGILGQSMHVKGYARRITFNPAFLMALNEASAKAGLVVRPHNLIQEFMGTGMRGNMSAAQFGLSSSQVGNLFSYGPQQPWGNYPQGGYGGPFQGRFGHY